jgi:hypothetical protein
MAGVFYDSLTNSTFFTTCCEVAICDHQQKCPRCKKDVYPFFEGMTDEERRRAAGGYYNHNTRMARMSQAGRRS